MPISWPSCKKNSSLRARPAENGITGAGRRWWKRKACKGTIQLGSDADLVVYDPTYRGKNSAKTHQMNLDYNPFEGMEIEGRTHVVTVRGKVAARDGKFVGEIGRGRFLAREPNHF